MVKDSDINRVLVQALRNIPDVFDLCDGNIYTGHVFDPVKGSQKVPRIVVQLRANDVSISSLAFVERDMFLYTYANESLDRAVAMYDTLVDHMHGKSLEVPAHMGGCAVCVYPRLRIQQFGEYHTEFQAYFTRSRWSILAY